MIEGTVAMVLNRSAKIVSLLMSSNHNNKFKCAMVVCCRLVPQTVHFAVSSDSGGVSHQTDSQEREFFRFSRNVLVF